MSKVVLDASALLAFLSEEPGADVVEPYFGNAYLSSVNFSEVLSVLTLIGLNIDEAKKMITPLVHIVDFDENQAVEAATLRKLTKSHGLSLGDRACLALAKQLKKPVLTADKVWNKLNLGIKIQLIR